MTGIPYDGMNLLLDVKWDLEYMVRDGKCYCWRCVVTPDQLAEWEETDRKTYGAGFQSRWQSGTHFYKASDFTTVPYGMSRHG